jgi:hypothetical protein
VKQGFGTVEASGLFTPPYRGQGAALAFSLPPAVTQQTSVGSRIPTEEFKCRVGRSGLYLFPVRPVPQRLRCMGTVHRYRHGAVGLDRALLPAVPTPTS